MDLHARIVHEQESAKEFLEELLKRDCLEGSALGITKKVLADGLESLSERQRYVFDTYVIEEFAIERCEQCCSPIPWSEMLAAYDNGGYCAYCWKIRDEVESP